jgi:hypothetical protein
MALVVSTQKETFLESFPVYYGGDSYINRFKHLTAYIFTLYRQEGC